MEVDGGGVGGNCVDIVESVEDLPKNARARVSLSSHVSHTRLDKVFETLPRTTTLSKPGSPRPRPGTLNVFI